MLGAISQVGVRLCAVCSGNQCGPGVEVCPGSLVLLTMFVAVLAGMSFLIAIGLSPRAIAAVAGGSESPAPGHTEPPFALEREILAPFCSFLGWGLCVLGLLLPWDIFGFCLDGPCEYPYVLIGWPLLLVILGAVLLGAGAIVFDMIGRIAPARAG